MTLYRKKKTPTGKEPVRAERNERRDSIITKNQQDYCSTSELLGQLCLAVREANDISPTIHYPCVRFGVTVYSYELIVFEGDAAGDVYVHEVTYNKELTNDTVREWIGIAKAIGERRREKSE